MRGVPTVIWWCVPCPSCGAAGLQPCTEGGKIVTEDVHLARATLFASARAENPQWGLHVLMNLSSGDYHPEDPVQPPDSY